MNNIVKFAAAAALALSSTTAFAQSDSSSALDTANYWEENAVQVGPGVHELWMDTETNTPRTDDDFLVVWEAATPEIQESFRTACTEWEKDQVLYTDSVAARCKMAADSSAG